MIDKALDDLLQLYPDLDRQEAAVHVAKFRGLLRTTLGEAVVRLRNGEPEKSVDHFITVVIRAFDGHEYARNFAELRASCEHFGIPTDPIVGVWTTPN